MSDDNFSSAPDEVSTPDFSGGNDSVAAPQGFFERLSNSFGAILFGLVLIPLACWGLFWNEGRAVKTARALEEGQGIVVSIPASSINPAVIGKLVHIAGDARSAGGVADPELGVKAPGLKLARKVEMFQWTEREEGSGQERKFVYSRDWRENPVNSSNFKAPNGHENPAFPIFRSKEFGAGDAKIGVVPVGVEATLALHPMQDFAISNAGLGVAQRVAGKPVQMAGGAYYMGQNPGQPRVGDIRVSYRIIPEGPAAFVGRFENDGIHPYRAKNGNTFLLAGLGAKSSDELFQTAQEENTTLTWIFRGVGLLVLVIGFSALFSPINLLASYVPILGSLVSGGIFLVAAAATAIVGTTVIAIAWFAYRPIVSLVVLALGFGIAYLFRQWRIKRQQARGQFIPATHGKA